MLSVDLKKNKNFVDIPGFSLYRVNKTGVVVNKQTTLTLTGSRNNSGYTNYRLKHDSGATVTIGRHRVIALAFLHPGVDTSNLVVNHLNGLKHDDRPDNLEWTTYTGNMHHAGLNDLTGKCIPLSVRDVDTGEVTKYPSIVDYARKWGISKFAINYRVKKGETRVFPERKQYRIGHGDEPWFIPKDIEKAVLENTTFKPIMVRNVLTNQVVTFPKISDMVIGLNIPAPTISLWLSAANQPVLPGFIQIKLACSNEPWREVKDPYLELAEYTRQKPIVAVNEQQGIRLLFMSGVECAKKMNLKTSTLNARLKTKGTKVYNDGYSYSYYADNCSSNGPAHQ